MRRAGPAGHWAWQEPGSALEQINTETNNKRSSQQPGTASASRVDAGNEHARPRSHPLPGAAAKPPRATGTTANFHQEAPPPPVSAWPCPPRPRPPQMPGHKACQGSSSDIASQLPSVTGIAGFPRLRSRRTQGEAATGEHAPSPSQALSGRASSFPLPSPALWGGGTLDRLEQSGPQGFQPFPSTVPS